MKREAGMEEPTGSRDATETIAAGEPHTAKSRRGPTWRGWFLSILVAILLSVTATLLLGGYEAFRSDRAIGAGAGHSGSWAGRGCCPPTVAGK
jgi:hypothetical protein